MKDNSGIVDKDAQITVVGRIRWLDVLRGICVVLMVLDHFALFFYNFYQPNIAKYFDFYEFTRRFISSDIRQYLRYGVISVFFIISGISCHFSSNNFKRGIRLVLAAACISAITGVLGASGVYDCLIICGVIHCYAIFVLLYTLINKITPPAYIRRVIAIICLAFILIAMLMQIFQPKINGSNALIFLGVPSDSYIAPMEYAAPTSSAWAFFAGVWAGYYIKNIAFKQIKAFPVLSFMGRHAAVIYFANLPVIYAIIRIMMCI